MRLTQTFRISFTILLSTLIFMSCKKNLADMTDGMMFSLDMNSFLQNQVQVQIVNANYQNSKTLPTATVTVSGKDAEKVFDINGSRTIAVEDQFANLAVSPGTPILEGNTLRFTLKAEAPGFLPIQKEIQVTNVDSFLNYTLEMIEIAHPPVGITINNATHQFNGNHNEIFINTNNNNHFTSTVSIPANARIIDDGGNLVSGNTTIRIEQYDPAIEPVRANIQNLISNFTYTTYQNGTSEDIHFQPFGFVRMSMDNNSGRKLHFQTPAAMEIALSSAIQDAISGETLKEGDVVSVYQKDNQRMGWDLKEDVIVYSDNGNLKVRFNFTNTDEIALARSRGNRNERTRNCGNFLGLKFIRNSNVNTLHYITVVNANNPNQVYLTASNVAVANNVIFNFRSRLPQNVQLKVLVYQFETATGRGAVVGASPVFSSCDYSTSNRLEIEVDPVQITNNPIARFQLYTVCLESKLVYFHEGRIQFRRAGSDEPFRDMGLALKTGNKQIEVTPGRIRGDEIPGSNNYSYLETDRMVDNTVYEFKTEIIGKRRKDGKTVRKTYKRDRIFNLNEFSPDSQTSPINYNFYIMNRSYWIAPEDACEDFGY